jgi:phage terminase small subunit
MAGKEDVNREKPLTFRERLFVEEYLNCWNASEAARRAGYSEKSAAEIGRQNLRKLDISRAIEARIAERAISANEVLARLAEQARFDANEFLSEAGELDMKSAKKKGLGKFIRRLKSQSGEHASVDIEFIDTQGALEKLGKHLKLFTEKSEISGTIESRVDLSAMSNEQLEARLALLERANERGARGD